MSYPKAALGLLLLMGYTGCALAQVEATGYGDKQTLSHLEGVVVNIRSSDVNQSEMDQKISRALRENVILPALKRAGIEIYTISESYSTESEAELRLEFAANYETGFHAIQRFEVWQTVQTQGGAEFTAETYSLSSSPAMRGFSSNMYPALSGGFSQFVQEFIRDWRAVH